MPSYFGSKRIVVFVLFIFGAFDSFAFRLSPFNRRGLFGSNRQLNIMRKDQRQLLKQIGEGSLLRENTANSSSKKQGSEELNVAAKKSRFPKIAYEATGPGSISEQALKKLLKIASGNDEDDSDLSEPGPVRGGVACPSAEAALRAAAQGGADFALVAVENSLTGTRHRRLELALRHNLHIVGELEHAAKLYLLRRPPAGGEEGGAEAASSSAAAAAAARYGAPGGGEGGTATADGGGGGGGSNRRRWEKPVGAAGTDGGGGAGPGGGGGDGGPLAGLAALAAAPSVGARCGEFLEGPAAEGLRRETALSMEDGAQKVSECEDGSLATIGTELIASTYGLQPVTSVDVQSGETDITRYILVGQKSVSAHLPPGSPAKTSVLFCLPDEGGALYRALACFSLREVHLAKIESRRATRELLQFMQRARGAAAAARSEEEEGGAAGAPGAAGGGTGKGGGGGGAAAGPAVDANSARFTHAFYLEFLGAEFDARPAAALAHLREQSSFVRVLGSYPRGGRLVGPVAEAVARTAGQVQEDATGTEELPGLVRDESKQRRLKIGIVGFGNFGQFLAKTFVKYADVYGINRSDKSNAAKQIGAKFYPSYDVANFLKNNLDVIIMCTSVISFEQMLGTLPKDQLRDCLLVDVLSVKMHPKEVMMTSLPPSTDILCTHPMFGPESGKYSWQGLSFVFDKVRISNPKRADQFLSIWDSERCKMVEMPCELHDEYAANSQFITHLMGRILGQQGLRRTPIDTKGFENVLNLVETTCLDSFDLFYSLYKYNVNSEETLRKLRESFALVERQIAAKEAYIAARAEIAMDERTNLLEECRAIIKEALATSTLQGATSDALVRKLLADRLDEEQKKGGQPQQEQQGGKQV